MTTYTRPLVNGTPTTGQVVKAGHVNEPIDQIYDTILAGGITADQIAAGAVDTSELATAAVTAAKMDGTLPDASAMATSAAPTTDAQLANKKYVDDQIVDAAPTAKAWCQIASNGTLQTGSFNIASSSNDSTGTYTISWDTDFDSGRYAVVITPHSTAGVAKQGWVSSVNSNACVVNMANAAGTKQDTAFSVIAFGAQ